MPVLIVAAAALQALVGLAYAGNAERVSMKTSLIDSVLGAMGSEWTDDDREAIKKLLLKAGSTPEENCIRSDAQESLNFATLFMGTGQGQEDWERAKEAVSWNQIELNFQASNSQTQSRINDLDARIAQLDQDIAKAEAAPAKSEASGSKGDPGKILEAVFKDLPEDILDDVFQLKDKIMEAMGDLANYEPNGFDGKIVEAQVGKNHSAMPEICEEVEEMIRDEINSNQAHTASGDPEALKKKKEQEVLKRDQLQADLDTCQNTRASVNAFKTVMTKHVEIHNGAVHNERAARGEFERVEVQMRGAHKAVEEQDAIVVKLVAVFDAAVLKATDVKTRLTKVEEKTKSLSVSVASALAKFQSLQLAFEKATKAAIAASDFKAKLILFISSMINFYREAVHNPIKVVFKHLTRDATFGEEDFEDSLDIHLKTPRELFAKMHDICHEGATKTALSGVDLTLCNHSLSFLCENSVIHDADDQMADLKQILISKRKTAIAIMNRLRLLLLPEQRNPEGFQDFMEIFVELEFATQYVVMWMDGGEDCESEGAASLAEGSLRVVDQGTRGALTKVYGSLENLKVSLDKKQADAEEDYKSLQLEHKTSQKEQEEVTKALNAALEKQAKAGVDVTAGKNLLKELEDTREVVVKRFKVANEHWEAMKLAMRKAGDDIVKVHAEIKVAKEAAAAALLQRSFAKEEPRRGGKTFWRLA